MDKINYILKYLIDELTESEKIDFERQLSESSDLRKQLEIERTKLNFLNQYSSVSVDDRYFLNIYPRFLQKMEETKSHISLKSFSTGFSFVLMIFLMLTVGINTGLRQSFYENLKTSANEEEILSFLELTSSQGRFNSLNINYEHVDLQLITTAYNNQISFESSELKNYINVNNIEVSEMMQNLNSEEFESIYEGLSEMKIL